MSGFWADGFWTGGFWSASFWGGTEAPPEAVPVGLRDGVAAVALPYSPRERAARLRRRDEEELLLLV